MKVETFKNKAGVLMSKLEDLILLMPDTEDSQSESQKEYLKQKLNEFSYAVNGTEQKDFRNT